MKRIPIRHLGILALCCGKPFADSIISTDLGVRRYRQLGVRERYKNEKPYRVCKRCIARLSS